MAELQLGTQATETAIVALTAELKSNTMQQLSSIEIELSNCYETILRDNPELVSNIAWGTALFTESTNIQRRLEDLGDQTTNEERNILLWRQVEITTNLYSTPEMRKRARELSELMRSADLIVVGTVITPTNRQIVLPNGSNCYYSAELTGIGIYITNRGASVISQIAVDEIIASRLDANGTVANMEVMENGVTGVYVVAHNSPTDVDPMFVTSTRSLVYLRRNDMDLTGCRPSPAGTPLHITTTSSVYRAVAGTRGKISLVRHDHDSQNWLEDEEIQWDIVGATSRLEVVECTRQLAQVMSVNSTNTLDCLITGPVSGLLSRTALRLKESGTSNVFKTTHLHLERQLVDWVGRPMQILPSIE